VSSRRRHLELLLAGLRPAGFAGSTELREQPLTDEQAHQIMVGVIMVGVR